MRGRTSARSPNPPGLEGAERTLRALADLGIDQTTPTLERERVEKFVTPFGALMQAIERAVERTGLSRTTR
ncbi:MAG: hypothetical protein H0U69_01380 [Trueperaceae bacterium]|nr:hypothetical protein [Trueperaceae bacterium]